MLSLAGLLGVKVSPPFITSFYLSTAPGVHCGNLTFRFYRDSIALASIICRWFLPIAVGFCQLPLALANGLRIIFFPGL